MVIILNDMLINIFLLKKYSYICQMKKLLIILAVATLFSCTKESVKPIVGSTPIIDTLNIVKLNCLVDSIGIFNGVMLTFDSEYYKNNEYYIPIERKSIMHIDFIPVNISDNMFYVDVYRNIGIKRVAIFSTLEEYHGTFE